MSTSADKTIVTWHLEKPVPYIGRVAQREEEEGEQEEEEVSEMSQMSSEINIKDYRYKSQKFFNRFPLHHLIDDAEHFSFVYEYL